MSKAKEYSPVKISKSQASDLTMLIARMQKSADKVEKNILRAEQLLAVDRDRDEKDQPVIHQKENAQNLAEAEGLLKNLFMDVDKSKKLHHPQAPEIERDVKNLHDRWVKDCGVYRDVYDQVNDLEPQQKIGWGPLLDDKLNQVNTDEYGPNLNDVEKQIANHNILHQEIEAYNEQLQPSTTTSKEQYAALKKKYAELLESSRRRHSELSSLYEYMQSCNKELVYLSGQQDRVLQRDWSDRMADAPGVRMEYEKFKTSGLIAHESEVNQLQEEGDRLVAMNHPGSPTIKAHSEAVQAEWQGFLNLCLAQEIHLDNIEDYKKFQLEAETVSESLNRLNSNLQPEALANKSNPAVLMELEGDEPAVRRNEQRLAALRELSGKVVPLKARRLQPSRPTAALALCDWANPEGAVSRGETLSLRSNADGKNWELQNSSGSTKTLPGACFMVPPPDEEALQRVNSLDRALADLKSNRSALMASLRNPALEVVRPQQTVTDSRALPEDPKAAQLASQLDKINQALDQNEKDILNRLRAPLDSRNPTQDLEERLRGDEKSAQAIRQLEAEKAAVQRELEPILAKKPTGPNAAVLPLKLSKTNNRLEDINARVNLYNKKATASMFLEKQIKKVDGIVSGYEEQLANDGPILDLPNGLQTRNQMLQVMRKDIASKKDELTKLSRDLDQTEQACGSLQQSFNEYCPDIARQRNQVKQLKNRYTVVNNQLAERSALIKEASNKNQDFQNAAQSLDFFLVNLPDNKIKPTDNVAQIATKESSQKRVVADINKKSDDLARVKGFSADLQNILNEYELKSNTYRSTINDDDDDDDDDEEDDQPLPKKRQTLARAVQEKEKDLLNHYGAASAENDQLLSQLGTTKNFVARNEDQVSRVVVNQQLQQQSQSNDLAESISLKNELNEETARRLQAEKDMELYRKRYVSLKSRRGVERTEEKDVLQYYRDPKLEEDLQSLRSRTQEETLKRSRTYSDIETINEKIIKLELQLTRVEPRLITRVMTEYERDPQLDKEAVRIREELQRLRLELQTRVSELVKFKSELTFISQQKQKVTEKIVKKEVVRLEKDPEMLKTTLVLQSDILAEESQHKLLNDSIFSTRAKINSLERVIPTIQPKIVTKVVKQVQQDPETVGESKKLRTALEEEREENLKMIKELTTMQLRYSEVENIRPKVDIQEKINEIYRVDPQTEVEIVRLRNELKGLSTSRVDLEREINTVIANLTTLRAQKPKVEYKEVTQDVIKEEKSPEVIRELQRLSNQVSRLQGNYDTTLELLTRLRLERDDLREEKSKVETKVVTKDLIKYENDPLLEKEVDRLRRDLREEIQQRRSIEEFLFDFQNQYIQLERQKPEEKIVIQEVVRLQKDPKQIFEHDRLNKNLDEEMKSRRKLELEVRQLRSLILNLESTLEQMDDRQKKIQVESELRRIRSRILELETSPSPVEEKIVIEEVLKVERDPNLENVIDSFRVELDSEGNNINRLDREIRNLRLKLEILQKEKSIEKVVYREVVRVEQDPAVEAEREHLRELLNHEKNLRRDQEDNLQSVHIKMTHVKSNTSLTSHEETTLVTKRDSLQREKDDFLRQLKMLESQRQNITVNFQQQSKLMSERNQMARQRSLKTSTEVQRLEQEILSEKDKIHQKDTLIMELQSTVQTEGHSETHTRETNLSTKITILDPETGKDMTPHEAYMAGLIEREQYIHLSELECDWEQITSSGPDGESTTILQDRKSGKQYAVADALRDGRLTQYDLNRFKEGNMRISEFALLVVGEKNRPSPLPMPIPRSPTKPIPSPTSNFGSMSSPLRSSYTSLNTINSSNLTDLSYHSRSMENLGHHSRSMESLNNYGSDYNSRDHHGGSLDNILSSAGDEHFAIAGIYDNTTNSRMSVRSALTRNLIDTDTALMLLEAQAASGGIVDLAKKDKISVHKAAQQGLIETAHLYKLLNSQKAFTGYEDPVSKQRLAVGEAVRKGFIPKENAMRYLEAQHLTGGLVDPSKVGRLTIQEALASNMIDSSTASELQDEAAYTKEIVDPISKEKITYKQAMDRCKKDVSTGLLLLPAASTNAMNTPSYSNYRFRY